MTEKYNVKVVVDPTAAEQGTKRVDKALNRTNVMANKLRATLARMFGMFIGIAAVVKGVRLLADFGQAMSTVQAITQATAEQFAILSEEAQRLGTTTRFSASEAADGMIFLARAGFEVDEVMTSISDTLNLAQAGALGLGQAADITSNVMQGFRLRADEAARVVDVLALAASSANTTVGQLGDGMRMVAPIASGMGVSLEEAAAAMAALSDAGLQASMAGTGLRRVLSELESPSSATQRLLGNLGLEMKDVRPTSVGLTKALQNLAAAGVDTGMALEIFGDRGGPAFEVLSDSIPKVVEMTEQLGNAGGTAKRIAGIMDKNLKGAFLGLRSAYEGLILRFGETGVTAALEATVRSLAASLRFLANNVYIVTAAVGAFATVVVMKLVRWALPLLLKKLALLRVAMLTNPFVLLAAGVAGAVAALGKLNREVDKYNDLMADVEKRGALTAFAVLGDRIMRIERAIKSAKKALAVTPGDIEATLMVMRLEDKLEKLQNRYKLMVAAEEAVRASKNATNDTYQTLFGNLKEEARLLKLTGKEREVLGEHAKLVRKLADEGVYLTTQQDAELEARLWNNQLLQDQAAVLEELRGPQEDEARRLSALKQLLDANTISQEEYNRAIEEGTGDLGPFWQRYAEVLNEIAGPQQQLEQDLRVIDQLLIDGAISVDEWTARMREMGLAADETGTSLSAGLSRGLERIHDEIQDVGMLAEDMLVNAFHSAEDALVGFVRTGKFEFMGMVDSMLDDIARLLVRLLVLQAVQAVTATGGSPVGAIGALAGRQHGGPVEANRPYLVGEEGPEIFEPATSGRVIPSDQTAAMLGGGGGTTVVAAPTPEVNVNVINVSDQNEVPAAMDSPAGDKVILNAIARNKNSARRLLS